MAGRALNNTGLKLPNSWDILFSESGEWCECKIRWELLL